MNITQTIRVAVAGATGYSGSELVALLARHRHVVLEALYGSAGSPARAFATVHPSLRGVEGPGCRPLDEAELLESAPEVVFLATPNETSAELAPRLAGRGIRVIDLSGAFRLRNGSEYPQWYGFVHPAPELLRDSAYGLSEWCNGELAKAQVIANPGCYPTSILLALKPLRHLIDRRQPIVINSLSGVSGAGRKSDLAYSFAELSGNCRAYGVGNHRHLPEIRQELDLATYTPLTFTPHLLPTVRGILSTIHVGFMTPRTVADLEKAFSRYDEAPFVNVRPSGEMPELRDVVGTPRCEIGFQLVDGGRRAVIVSVIDNLLKGAASQAVQNFNRSFGFDETEGLA